MKCPFCGESESKVTDSRTAVETNAIRRRRECLTCEKRFTTFETVDTVTQIKKRDGSYEDFSIEKLIKGLDAASRHTSISRDQVRNLASDIACVIAAKQTKEIHTTLIGQIIMDKLKSIDTVAYIRFGCVYKRFKAVDEIMDAIHSITPEQVEEKQR